jgi:hypothetical protein
MNPDRTKKNATALVANWPFPPSAFSAKSWVCTKMTARAAKNRRPVSASMDFGPDFASGLSDIMFFRLGPGLFAQQKFSVPTCNPPLWIKKRIGKKHVPVAILTFLPV